MVGLDRQGSNGHPQSNRMDPHLKLMDHKLGYDRTGGGALRRDSRARGKHTIPYFGGIVKKTKKTLPPP